MRTLRKVWRERLVWLLTASLFAPLAIVAAAWGGDLHPKIDVFGHFLLPALWLAGATALLAIALRAPRLFFFAIATLGLGAARVTGLAFVPTPVVAPVAKISVLQINKWRDNPTPEAVAALIRARDADVVVLIEALHADRALFDDLYPHVIAESRWELRPSHIRVLSRHPLTLQGFGRGLLGESRMIIQVDTPHGPLRLVPFHFTRPWPFADPHIQAAQARSLSDLIGPADGPTLVLGDCNCVPWGATARLLERELGVHGASGRFEGTWPTRLQTRRPDSPLWPRVLGIPIDLAFASKDLRIANLDVIADPAGSDHRPVAFDLVFPTEPGAPAP
jgi:endonuclease/exonuclease/phosphatase (EEP) superfamily protein YafD